MKWLGVPRFGVPGGRHAPTRQRQWLGRTDPGAQQSHKFIQGAPCCGRAAQAGTPERTTR
jgi:hypothetical protein